MASETSGKQKEKKEGREGQKWKRSCCVLKPDHFWFLMFFPMSSYLSSQMHSKFMFAALGELSGRISTLLFRSKTDPLKRLGFEDRG